ncbi:MAG: hypothetical protein KDK00_06125 [Rhodobacteraceae bacterium]|nr:hypothetical protein [Paracoccaceae bacterium]
MKCPSILFAALLAAGIAQPVLADQTTSPDRQVLKIENPEDVAAAPAAPLPQTEAETGAVPMEGFGDPFGRSCSQHETNPTS